MLAFHSCDDSQLWMKNVEKKNQKIAKSVQNPKILKLLKKI